MTDLSIPLEIVDIVLDYLHQDLETVSACSLVCKSWFPSARYHLFADTNLDDENAYSFVRLLHTEYSTVPRFITRIAAKDTCETGRWLPTVFPCLSRLPSLSSVSITSTFEACFTEATLFALGTFDNLLELKLTECAFSDFTQVQELLTSLPTLERLHLEADWPEPVDVKPTDLSPSPHLRELYLRCEATRLLDWFLMMPNMAPVEKLTLHGIDSFDLPIVVRYLEALGPSLTHLSIYPSGRLYDALCSQVNLSTHPNLQYLKLVIDCDSSNLLMARDLLSQIPNNSSSPSSLEEIELSFYSIRQVSKTADQWATLDALLAKPQFASLSKMTVSAMIAASLARTTLPLCEGRGILRILHQ
jgi:hypothetical protein